MNTQELAAQAARTSGLTERTCLELLNAGWQLELKLNESVRWVQVGARHVVAAGRSL